MRAWLANRDSRPSRSYVRRLTLCLELGGGVYVIDVNLRCCAKDRSATWAPRAMTPCTKSASRSGAPRRIDWLAAPLGAPASLQAGGVFTLGREWGILIQKSIPSDSIIVDFADHAISAATFAILSALSRQRTQRRM